MGINLVRIFLLANGFAYGTGPVRRNTPSPSPSVPFFDWRFDPPTRTDERFKLHFRRLLERFDAAKMKMIPSLIDFQWVGNSLRSDDKGLAPRGRADCIKDKSKRATFLNTVLADLLMESIPFQDKKVIFAWEVMNEPFWTLTPFGPLSEPDISPYDRDFPLAGLARIPEVSAVELNDFFHDAIQLIESLGFESTVGHRGFDEIFDRTTAQERSRLEIGTRPQFHYYSKFFLDPPQIKGEGLFRLFKNGRKAFLGEFDSDFDLHKGRPWQELRNGDTTLARLELLQSEGCQLALLWPDKNADEAERRKRNLKLDVPDPIKLRNRTRAAIVKFTGGSLPEDDVTDDDVN
jgi:hypothetical protein